MEITTFLHNMQSATTPPKPQISKLLCCKPGNLTLELALLLFWGNIHPKRQNRARLRLFSHSV